MQNQDNGQDSNVVFHNVITSYPPSELKGLRGVPNYAARVVAASKPGDVVILPPSTMPYLGWARGHFEEVGLRTATEFHPGDSHTMAFLLGKLPNHGLDVFFFDEACHKARPHQKWLQQAEYLNSKNNFIQLCEVLGVETPETTIYNKVEEVKGFPEMPVYVKKAVSASGFGVWRCETDEQFQNIVMLQEAPFQVQEALPIGTQFLNVQYRVASSGQLEHGPVTLQILKGNSHDGNSFPVLCDKHDIWRSTDILARHAFESGMSGVWAYDVAVTTTGQVLPIECNPRYNGASYYSIVAEKLGVQEWESRNLDFRARTYEGFKLGELSYNSNNGLGVVFVNWACAGEGMIGVFLAGPPATRAEYLEELKARVS